MLGLLSSDLVRTDPWAGASIPRVVLWWQLPDLAVCWSGPREEPPGRLAAVRKHEEAPHPNPRGSRWGASCYRRDLGRTVRRWLSTDPPSSAGAARPSPPTRARTAAATCP